MKVDRLDRLLAGDQDVPVILHVLWAVWALGLIAFADTEWWIAVLLGLIMTMITGLPVIVLYVVAVTFVIAVHDCWLDIKASRTDITSRRRSP